MATQERRAVHAKLTGFWDQCEELMNILADKNHLSQEERVHVEALYRLLKSNLKKAAEFGTLSGKKSGRTEVEQNFYAPGVYAAALALSPPVNSNPISSDWYSALYDAQLQLRYLMPEIEGE